MANPFFDVRMQADWTLLNQGHKLPNADGGKPKFVRGIFLPLENTGFNPDFSPTLQIQMCVSSRSLKSSRLPNPSRRSQEQRYPR